ncbi:FAD-dependent oxidoreductase [Streptomyces sp. E11-3]|uniref:FAD-dependent oxidoreductase n=1 Tax=Streptomyces sp. E11-3 TaxID=3110112 RepID=UPI0039818FF3
MNGNTGTNGTTHTTGATETTDATGTTAQRHVIVTGAGPTGLLLAGDLAAAGIPVTVLEKRPAGISNLTRAFGVHARTLEQLDARGLADELVKTGQPLTEIRLFGQLSLQLGGLRSRFPFLLSTPQYEVERLLHRRATEQGVAFVYGAEVTAVRQDSAGVEVEVRHEDGTASTYQAAYLVGADGVHSAVRKAIGQAFPGRPVISSIVLADVKLDSEPDLTVAVNGSNDSFGFIIPFGDGYWRVGGWNRAHSDVPDSAPTSLDELRAISRRAFGSDFGMHDERWISRFHSDERQVAEYRTGRVFLAGDAAHTHSPAGGQGMNTGLQDAANLSWKLAAVLKGHSPETLLDTYQSERHPVGKAVLRSSGSIVRLATAHNTPQYAIRSLLTSLLNRVRPAREKAVGQITGIGYAYGAPRGAHRLVGRRAPDVALADDGRLYEALRAGKFVLITPADTTVATDGDRVVGTHWATGDRGTTLLIRPDGYVAWASDRPDPTALRSALAEWTMA